MPWCRGPPPPGAQLLEQLGIVEGTVTLVFVEQLAENRAAPGLRIAPAELDLVGQHGVEFRPQPLQSGPRPVPGEIPAQDRQQHQRRRIGVHHRRHTLRIRLAPRARGDTQHHLDDDAQRDRLGRGMQRDDITGTPACGLLTHCLRHSVGPGMHLSAVERR